ncbi:hypothetical protein [Micromonospora sp. NBC_01638]|uniref:hypothetical protein n=1 Tax=Micromonospora sp. NBC_01638 TaxID=2975982 RepID=UPI0038633DD1|nr:hypothetical protein OG811_06350 [Micromonospora sp. NBC_01638]
MTAVPQLRDPHRRRAGHLVDAGIGPADAPAASWAPVPGRMPAELAAASIDPADVDTVVLVDGETTLTPAVRPLSTPSPPR